MRVSTKKRLFIGGLGRGGKRVFEVATGAYEFSPGNIIVADRNEEKLRLFESKYGELAKPTRKVITDLRHEVVEADTNIIVTDNLETQYAAFTRYDRDVGQTILMTPASRDEVLSLIAVKDSRTAYPTMSQEALGRIYTLTQRVAERISSTQLGEPSDRISSRDFRRGVSGKIYKLPYLRNAGITLLMKNFSSSKPLIDGEFYTVVVETHNSDTIIYPLQRIETEVINPDDGFGVEKDLRSRVRSINQDIASVLYILRNPAGDINSGYLILKRGTTVRSFPLLLPEVREREFRLNTTD